MKIKFLESRSGKIVLWMFFCGIFVSSLYLASLSFFANASQNSSPNCSGNTCSNVVVNPGQTTNINLSVSPVTRSVDITIRKIDSPGGSAQNWSGVDGNYVWIENNGVRPGNGEWDCTSSTGQDGKCRILNVPITDITGTNYNLSLNVSMDSVVNSQYQQLPGEWLIDIPSPPQGHEQDPYQVTLTFNKNDPCQNVSQPNEGCFSYQISPVNPADLSSDYSDRWLRSYSGCTPGKGYQLSYYDCGQDTYTCTDGYEDKKICGGQNDPPSSQRCINNPNGCQGHARCSISGIKDSSGNNISSVYIGQQIKVVGSSFKNEGDAAFTAGSGAIMTKYYSVFEESAGGSSSGFTLTVPDNATTGVVQVKPYDPNISDSVRAQPAHICQASITVSCPNGNIVAVDNNNNPQNSAYEGMAANIKINAVNGASQFGKYVWNSSSSKVTISSTSNNLEKQINVLPGAAAETVTITASYPGRSECSMGYSFTVSASLATKDGLYQYNVSAGD